MPRHWHGKKVMEYLNAEVEFAIDQIVHSERNRRILKRRLIDGICFEPLAEEANLSVRQVKNIVYRERERIFRHLAQMKSYPQGKRG